MKNKALDSIKYAFDINKLLSFFNNIVLIPYDCVFDVRIKGLFTPVVQGSRKASGKYIRFFSTFLSLFIIYAFCINIKWFRSTNFIFKLDGGVLNGAISY